MKIIKASNARSEFQDLIDTVHYKEEQIIITKRDKPWVAIRPLTKMEVREYSKKKKK